MPQHDHETQLIGEASWKRTVGTSPTINDRRARQRALQSELPPPVGEEGEIRDRYTTTSSMEKPRLVCSNGNCTNREPLFLTTTDQGRDLCERCTGSDLIQRSQVRDCPHCRGTGLI
jgi:hypothetical protein